SRPEHVMTALPRAFRMMTDPANCGPATLAFCQDVQAEAFDYPVRFFEPKVWYVRRPEPDLRELAEVVAAIRAAKKPVIVSGGGVLYSGAEAVLAEFAAVHQIPVVETQAGKGAIDWKNPLNFGSPGVTGSASANAICEAADLIIGVGTRFQDFTTGSWSLFKNPNRRLISINLAAFDAAKHNAISMVSDAKIAMEHIGLALKSQKFAAPDFGLRDAWFKATAGVKAAPKVAGLPTDAQVIGAVQRVADDNTIVMCAAGTMPGALQVLWDAAPGGYHMEYGYSCMGYEVAGALGIAMARPEAEVICFVGDGSYMMANSELASAVMLGVPFTIVLTDNRGYGCINRLQIGCGGAPFNNMYADSRIVNAPTIDFVAHAGSMGAHSEKVADIAGLEAAIKAARGRKIPSVIVIDTDAAPGTGVGGYWWDVAVPAVSARANNAPTRANYEEKTKHQRSID
ncbi:MAG: thiamine pyrophosphate-dependent enzyme, partial [Paracoccaceae bacterium]